MSHSRRIYEESMRAAGHAFTPDEAAAQADDRPHPAPHPQWDDPEFIDHVQETLIQLSYHEQLSAELGALAAAHVACQPHRHQCWRNAAAAVLAAASALTDAELGDAAPAVRTLTGTAPPKHTDTEPPPPTPNNAGDELAALREALAKAEAENERLRTAAEHFERSTNPETPDSLTPLAGVTVPLPPER